MIRLLDPIIADNGTLTMLVNDGNASSWTDGSLNDDMKSRLASEHDRFLRVMKRMKDIMTELKGLLKIEDGQPVSGV